jgi:predicted DNA-binding WGR domain protein
MRRFEFKGSKSSKFWEVSVQGKSLHVAFGRIGTDGQTKSKTYASPAKATAEMGKLIHAKTTKGYVEVRSKGKRPVKTAKTVLYPEIQRLKSLGATQIRIWFQGVGDDGGFVSTVYKGTKVLDKPHTLDISGGDVEHLYTNHDLELPDGLAFGQVSIMTLDLKTGEALISPDDSRLCELLDNLVWEGVDQVEAKLDAEELEEAQFGDLELTAVTKITMATGKPQATTAVKERVQGILRWWLHCHNQDIGYGDGTSFYDLESSKVSLNICTSKRRLVFASGQKKDEFKVEAMKKKTKLKIEM